MVGSNNTLDPPTRVTNTLEAVGFGSGCSGLGSTGYTDYPI